MSCTWIPPLISFLAYKPFKDYVPRQMWWGLDHNTGNWTPPHAPSCWGPPRRCRNPSSGSSVVGLCLGDSLGAAHLSGNAEAPGQRADWRGCSWGTIQ